MILRKPYAFFIKNFKLIHFIMAILMGILMIQTNSFLNFFNKYLNQNSNVLGQDLVSDLFMNFIFVYIFLIFLMDIVIWVLMEFKKKKRLFYILSFFGYVVVLALFIYVRSILTSMGQQIVDNRVVMVVRDFVVICFTFQTLTTFLTFIRAIGINIKQFDFESDIKQLNIEENDNEEFEVNIELNSEKIRRNVRMQIRNFKYYFLENKRMILVILIIIVTVIGIFIYQGFRGNITKYNQGQYFNVPNYSMKVSESYITSRDYRFASIGDDKSLVILKISIKTTNNTSQFSFGKFALQVDGNKYYHMIEYTDKIKDLGKAYVKQKLTNTYKEYLLVYEIPSSIINERMSIVYVNNLSTGIFENDKITQVSLKPQNLDIDKNDINFTLSEPITLEHGVLKGAQITLESAEIAEIFKINYNSCVSKNECYSVYEVLQAPFYGNYDKALLKLKLSISDGSGYNNIAFITSFGEVVYKINGQIKTINIQKQLSPVKVKSQSNYFEIPKEVLNSDYVMLNFYVRNQKYTYQIR